jgi:uncharacterized protein DUF1579
MKIACCLALAVSSATVMAAEKPAAKAVAPEIEKTVAALAGRWTLSTTVTAPGTAPVTFPETVECRRAVMGRALSCVDTATMPGMGATEYAYLIGYDVETGTVHLFSIGSPGEVHDHKCVWRGEKALDCEPHVGTMGGAPSTETVSFVFAGDAMTLNATTAGPDGTVVIQAKGTRGR